MSIHEDLEQIKTLSEGELQILCYDEFSKIYDCLVENTSKEQVVAIAAARALGKIATSEATKALAAAREKATGELKMRIEDSYLLCADSLLKQGKKAEAAAIYKQVSQAHESGPLRLAALQGLLKAGQIKTEN